MFEALVISAIVLALAGLPFVASARERMEMWAEANRLALLEVRRSLWGGPFWYRRGRAVFYVIARDYTGRVSRGWVCCGRPGRSTAGTDVVWDRY